MIDFFFHSITVDLLLFSISHMSVHDWDIYDDNYIYNSFVLKCTVIQM